jgi:hypothetical protein
MKTNGNATRLLRRATIAGAAAALGTVAVTGLVIAGVEHNAVAATTSGTGSATTSTGTSTGTSSGTSSSGSTGLTSPTQNAPAVGGSNGS